MNAVHSHSSERHEWRLSELLVTQVIVDPGSVRVIAWHLEGSIELRLGSSFIYVEADGVERLMDPEQPEQLAPLLTLVNRPLEMVTVHRSGGLGVQFGDGSYIRCEPDAQYEAWEARGAGVLEEASYLCGPGGGSPWGAA